MSEYKLNFPSFEADEIIIREGEALPMQPPLKIKISGDINTVKNFLSFRGPQSSDDFKDLITPPPDQFVGKASAVVIADKENFTITLLLNPGDFYGTEIIAVLELAPELKQFHINEVYNYSREQFIKLIRFNKMFFDSPDANEKLLNQLVAFTANTNLFLQKRDDNRGNKNASFNKEVTTDILTDFILNVPIFKNGAPVRFRVEIAFDVTETAIKFWFESVELSEAVKKLRDEIFSDQLTACEGLVIIYK